MHYCCLLSSSLLTSEKENRLSALFEEGECILFRGSVLFDERGDYILMS